jgi:hypothetical protein
MNDQVEAVEVLHNQNAEDLHFRYIGTARGRQFVLNVQFDSADGRTKEAMLPVEYDFMITKILGLVLERLGTAPNSGLH